MTRKDEYHGTTAIVMIDFPPKIWLGKISREFPYYRIEIKSFIPISQDPFIGNSLIHIKGNNIGKIKKRLAGFQNLIKYHIMDESKSHISINAHTKDQILLDSIVNSELLVNFPVIIEKGMGRFNIASSRKSLDEFLVNLDKHNIHYKVKTIEDYSDKELKLQLTSKQYKVYQKAKESGYYDVPRQITLTKLAKKIGVAKSSLSSMLQRIHNRLLGG